MLGRHFSVFYPPQDVAAGKPRHKEQAALTGSYTDDGWRVRQDGTRFWAHVVLTALHDGDVLRGFAKVTRDDTQSRAAQESNQAMQRITRALLAGVHPNELLSTVTQLASRLTGAACTFLAISDHDGLVVQAREGTVEGPPVGSRLPEESLLTDVVRAGTATFLDDLAAARPRVAGMGRLGAGLAVPFGAGRDVEGVLVAAAVRGASPFRPDDVALLRTFAAQTELVLRYHRAQAVLRATQISQHRDRIAHDLHDHVIQQLFTAGMPCRLPLQRARIRTRGCAVESPQRGSSRRHHPPRPHHGLRPARAPPDAPGSVRADILARSPDAARVSASNPHVQFAAR